MSAELFEKSPADDDAAGLIARVPPFCDLPSEALRAVADAAEIRRYSRGETIYALGQYDGGEVIALVEGAMKITRADLQSGAMVMDLVSALETFGLADAVAGGGRGEEEGLTLTCEDDAVLVSIEVDAFRLIVAQRPSLTRNLMQHFAETLSRARLGVVSPETSPERRVYAALLEYVERDPVSADWRVKKMPKHRELAEKTGVSEAVVAAAVAQIIQDDVARRDYPGLVIADMARLNRLAS